MAWMQWAPVRARRRTEATLARVLALHEALVAKLGGAAPQSPGTLALEPGRAAPPDPLPCHARTAPPPPRPCACGACNAAAPCGAGGGAACGGGAGPRDAARDAVHTAVAVARLSAQAAAPAGRARESGAVPRARRRAAGPHGVHAGDAFERLGRALT